MLDILLAVLVAFASPGPAPDAAPRPAPGGAQGILPGGCVVDPPGSFPEDDIVSPVPGAWPAEPASRPTPERYTGPGADEVAPIWAVFNEQERYSVRDVRIDGEGPVVRRAAGGTVTVSMRLRHDCRLCGDAVNQVIVGLAGEDRAQVTVWNGKQRSGGPVVTVNAGSRVAALAQDNPGPAEWVTVHFTLDVPDAPGVYYVRTRYAQAWRGNLRTADALQLAQPTFQPVLGWWRVDRPNGPSAASNIGAIIVR